MKTYLLEPQDLLFFRDGRPIETSGGHGARWPDPSVIFDALHAALWRAFPADQPQPWEHRHDFGRSSQRPHNGDTQRFGSLATAGLFPVVQGRARAPRAAAGAPPDALDVSCRWLFPAPADVAACDDARHWLLRPRSVQGTTNLPACFLKYTVASLAKPTKDTVPPWWSAAAWQSYLTGTKPDPSELFTPDDLFAAEWTTGIGMDPETQTQDGQRLYSAEYLRFRPDVRCGFTASLRMKQNGNGSDLRECIRELFATTQTIIVGGQQRTCRVEEAQSADRLPFPVGPAIAGTRVKWVLLSPAIWPAIQADESKGIAAHPGGWLPNWVCPQSGEVRLRHRSGNLRRVWDEARGRPIRRADVDEAIAARLVAACVPKPVPITGWTERLHLLRHETHWGQDGGAHGPRPSHLAVPAGAVYYFEAEANRERGTTAEEEAARLAAALNWHGHTPGTEIRNRRSTLLGEKGFGLGVCGTWDLYGEGGAG